MISLGSKRWTSENPNITLSFAYEKQRSGADMQYRARITVAAVSGSSYFGFPIYLKLSIGGTRRVTETLKDASPSQWSSAITYTSPWYTVSNKTTGTTPVSFNVYSGLGSSRSATYSYNMAVDPAASAISAPNGTLGTALTLTLTRYNPSFTDTITYKCGSVSGTIASGSTATSIPWSITNGNVVALAAQNTERLTVDVTFTVTTYSGSTVVGTNTAKVSMAIPATVKPSVALSIDDAAGYQSIYGAYVQGYSKLRITATPTLAHGSPIKTYAITADGGSYSTSPVTTEAVKGKGTLNVTAKVTDARTRSSDLASLPITVLEYAKPVVNLSAYRCGSDGTRDDEGAFMRVELSATISSLNGKNSASLVITYVNDDGETATIGAAGTSYTTGIIPCDRSNTRTISAIVTDKLSSTPKDVTIPIAYTLTDYHHTGRGVTFGKVATREGFDCAMPAYFTGGVHISDQPVADHIVEQGTSGIWTYRKWSSGIAECWGSHKEASLNCGENNGGGFYYSKSVTVPFPSGLFSDSPLVVLDGGSYTYVNFVRNFGSDKNQAIFLAVGLLNTVADVHARIYAKGKWK